MACGRISNFCSLPLADVQSHVHEYTGSTRMAELSVNPHNHRYVGITGEVIPLPGNNHKHKLLTNSDYYVDHLHIVSDETGPCICIGYGKHVHAIAGRSGLSDGHYHEYVFATEIENPSGKREHY